MNAYPQRLTLLAAGIALALVAGIALAPHF